ncbi:MULTISPECIES: DUF4013 domain-containing protein [unclassified Haladaptatus]|uniref:DUF4013 domain-containing protein n=1 Tax=unclassified Haladaptatus TaxID=2622732 RepID=UPI00209C03C2|nr:MULTISPECIES: DUF4013 domain-containing protein [unclassified Haladaptatus]MCO8246021.1 DUF4013 domain-containing protein [Haladaptatus sp. AB643]MCO8254358.1 DUF4013 domain-containing protein [Haladaptatus sp. AB618]
MLEEAIGYPTKGDSGIARIIIGGTLAFFSFLLIPGIFVGGYMMQVLAATSRDEELPPDFTDWGVMFVDGIKGFVVGFVYALVPIVIMIVMFTLIGLGNSGDSTGVLSGIGVLGLLVTFVLAFAIQYLLPAALTNLARTGSIGAAFDFETLGPVLKSTEYITAVVLTLLVAIAGGMFFAVFVAVTLGFGVILAPFFYFWLYLAGCYMFGTAFGKEVTPRQESTERTATSMD